MGLSTESLLEAAREAALVTGHVALRHFRSDLVVERKSDGSEVTVADRAAESAARAWLAARFPDDGIIGEELPAVERPGARRWYIDPIDGTRSFVRGVPLWGSMIAVEEEGTVVAGAICCPATGDLVVAARDAGCWHNGVRARVSTVSSLDHATILTSDDRFLVRQERAKRWDAVARLAAVSRSWGDCYGYVLVATGRAELMADDRLSPWDAAPLLPIIAEAGGTFTDWRGRAGIIGRDGIASNALLAAELRHRLGVPPRMAERR
jgi:histidinol phosphatase-like enzyme (inositol monophosphatase family)